MTLVATPAVAVAAVSAIVVPFRLLTRQMLPRDLAATRAFSAAIGLAPVKLAAGHHREQSHDNHTQQQTEPKVHQMPLSRLFLQKDLGRSP